MATISFKHINKVYDNKVQAVFDFNLEVKDKEFIVFVGPSGCGKSTTLRMLAGLEEITSGELYVGTEMTYVNSVFKEENPLDSHVFSSFHNLDVVKGALQIGGLTSLKEKEVASLTDASSFAILPVIAEDNKTHFESLFVKAAVKTAEEPIKVLIAKTAKMGNIVKEVELSGNGEEIDIEVDDIIKASKVDQLFFKFIIPEGAQLLSIKANGKEQRLLNAVEPKNRDIAMVFQNYALYPHMTVAKNIAFGLKLRKIDKAEIEKRVTETASILGLTPYLERKPGELSGGQRQRVALGRAIVRSPKIFLMDEPLSNLDAKLRVSMRSEIAKIHERVGATTIYVTHDQTEAMTMATRIVVMKDGWIQQIGSPEEVYNLPNNIFVGGFMGSPSMNFLSCRLKGEKVSLLDENKKSVFDFTIPMERAKTIAAYYKAQKAEAESDLAYIEELIAKEGDKKVRKVMEDEKAKIIDRKAHFDSVDGKSFDLVLGVRPEDIHLTMKADDKKLSAPLSLEADVIELLGNELIVYAWIGGQKTVIKMSVGSKVAAKTSSDYGFDLDKIRFFDPVTTDRIK